LTDTASPAAAILVAFVVTVVILTSIRPVARAIGLVDRPGGRKNHVGDVPIVGGVAMFAGMFAAFTLLPSDLFSWPPIFAASAILVFVGVADDSIHIPATIRLLAQIAVVLLMVSGAGLSLASIGDPFGSGEITMGRFTLVFTMLVTLAMINAYNLVDGVDGLAGSFALLALLAVAAVAGYGHPMTDVSLVMSAAIVGFLIFNFPTPWNRIARTFMGDAGSTLLGFTIVWVTLGVSQGDDRLISPVHCLWFASIPIYDLFTCFVRRMSKGKSPFTPGHDHFHHTLKRGGFGVRRTLGTLVGLQAIYAIVGIIGFEAMMPDVVMFVAWSVLGLSQYYVVRLIARHHRAYQLRKRTPRVSV
jgi:UDP-GlcNAc:undecaprenyl-phosphate GlcNAc-1-phosphate transferase